MKALLATLTGAPAGAAPRAKLGYSDVVLAFAAVTIISVMILPLPLVPGSVIRAIPVGVLKMTDEAGSDEKLIAVPVPKVFGGYAHITDIEQVSKHWLERIGHFFEHYKDLEKGKWVKLEGWGGAAEAKQILVESMKRFNDTPDAEKPHF